MQELLIYAIARPPVLPNTEGVKRDVKPLEEKPRLKRAGDEEKLFDESLGDRVLPKSHKRQQPTDDQNHEIDTFV